MRGKGADHLRSEVCLGITPACAGKSLLARTSSACPWDHPRVCGEKTATSPQGNTAAGSPPRMRGKVFSLVLLCYTKRITPAYAGKSVFLALRSAISWDHPRVCGEKAYVPANWGWLKGSPPRMRGKGRRWPESVAANGITPAYAGKSLCGLCLCRSRLGSPPRMRGKERLAKNQRSVHGITPAYAGKRKVCDGSRHETRDHPRVCGEKIISMLKASFGAGSPPRMRGKVAGICTSGRASKDHPRVCGEKLLSSCISVFAWGSPPRMRGKEIDKKEKE